MEKQAGLWIDHRKAIIVLLDGTREVTREIDSGVEKRVRLTGRTSSEDGSTEDVRDRQFGLHINSYYDQVITVLRQADSILILGPGEAKNELHKRLEHAGLKERILAVESADRLTERQVAAKVRERFIK